MKRLTRTNISTLELPTTWPPGLFKVSLRLARRRNYDRRHCWIITRRDKITQQVWRTALTEPCYGCTDVDLHWTLPAEWCHWLKLRAGARWEHRGGREPHLDQKTWRRKAAKSRNQDIIYDKNTGGWNNIERYVCMSTHTCHLWHLPRFGRGLENKIDTQINEPDHKLLVARANVSFR